MGTLKHSANKELTITPSVESSSEKNNSEDMVTKEGMDDGVSSRPDDSDLQANSIAPEVTKSSNESPKKEINKNSVTIGVKAENRPIDNNLDTSNDAIGVNEIDSSISKSVVLSSEDGQVSKNEEDRTKEDAMEVDTECTGSESHIETSSTIM